MSNSLKFEKMEGSLDPYLKTLEECEKKIEKASDITETRISRGKRGNPSL